MIDRSLMYDRLAEDHLGERKEKEERERGKRKRKRKRELASWKNC
jgi:hypothetical protein